MTITHEIKRRKLIPWIAIYLAVATLILLIISAMSDRFHWSALVMREAPVFLTGGLLTVGYIAWYHGPGGKQRLRPVELGTVTAILVLTAAVAFLIGR